MAGFVKRWEVSVADMWNYSERESYLVLVYGEEGQQNQEKEEEEEDY